MNTSKQVNVMVGFLFILVVGTLLYFLWDSARAEDAEERQLRVNAERGGELYALNCRACHGLTGKGALENPNLPGIPLNIEQNRPEDIGKLQALQARFRDTIVCGRVGTLMPPWSEEQGGSLNDFQIHQLVLLITSAASEEGWEAAIEAANHADELGKHLAEEASATDTVLSLDDARGLKPDDLLRLDDDPTDEVYEVVRVLDAPAQTKLLEDVGPEATELRVQGARVFQPGDTVVVDEEQMRVISGTGDILEVERGVNGTQAKSHSIETAVYEVGNEISVERGFFGTEATEHAAGTEVFAGPILPPEGPLTGESGTPPCGQRPAVPAAPAATPTPQPAATPQPSPTPVSGTISLEMGDNFFQLGGEQNPTLTVKAGETITVSLKNGGLAIHNMRVAGEDNQYNTGDDEVSEPVTIVAGGEGTLQLTLNTPGTYSYRCDFHADVMKGQIVVIQ